MNFNILAQQLACDAVIVPEVVDKGNFCWCNYNCAPRLRVFAGDTTRENDNSSFLFYRIGAADTVAMTLWKEGAQVATLTNNNYGTFYDFGSLANNNLKGYRVNWKLVYNAFGGGAYKVKAASVLLGTTINFESANLVLTWYNELAANKTVRIETYQNGYTESSPIDFTGVNWYSQIRLPGNMKDKQPQFTTDNYKDTLRNKIQIQDSIANTYTLELISMSDDMKDVVITDVLLSNRIIITDYTIDNNDRYKAIELYPSEIAQVGYHVNKPDCFAVIKFTDKKENIIKRNRI